MKNWLIIFLCVIVTNLIGQGFCEKTELMYSFYERFHVENKVVDADFREGVKKGFLADIDPFNFILSQEDIDELLLVNQPCDFVSSTAIMYSERINEFDKVATAFLKDEIDFSQDDKVSFYENLEGLIPSSEMLKHRKEVLKYMVLEDLFFTYDFVDKDSFNLPDQMVTQVEVSERLSKRIAKKSQSPEDRLKGLQNKYLNAIAEQFDPHSNFFSMDEKEDFENSIAKEVTTFGVSFGENDDDEIIVVSMMPGGPAWKTGDIHIGDVVLEIKVGSRPPKNTSSMSAKKANKLLRDASGKEVSLVVRGEDGKAVKSSLKEEVTEVEDNVISSFILDGKNKVGYIELPGFYSDFGGDFGLGCANDVAKELMKLKQEGINGLILDLRFNGGGSLKEALDLAGIFINEGPLLVYNQRFDKPRVSKDRNRGSIFDGPLTIMVNGASASASEILCKIFQDYNRAVIVGEETFGKATAQNILPLDTNSFDENLMPRSRPNNDLGYTKITLGKIYGVDLKTYQNNGIQPDVKIPSYYEGIIPKESDYPTALTADEIEKNIYNFNPLTELPISELKTASKTRVGADSIFKAVKALNKDLVAVYNNFKTNIPLGIKAYEKLLEKKRAIEEEIDLLGQRLKPSYKVLNTAFEKEILKISEYAEERNQKIIDALNQDFQLNEAFIITQQLITTNK